MLGDTQYQYISYTYPDILDTWIYQVIKTVITYFHFAQPIRTIQGTPELALMFLFNVSKIPER